MLRRLTVGMVARCYRTAATRAFGYGVTSNSPTIGGIWLGLIV